MPLPKMKLWLHLLHQFRERELLKYQHLRPLSYLCSKNENHGSTSCGHTKRELVTPFSYPITFSPDTATRKERSDFLVEIDMMKKISEGFCANVVNMVGCVTLQEPLCLITEFLSHGDLLDYLRDQRKKVQLCLSIVVSSKKLI